MSNQPYVLHSEEGRPSESGARPAQQTYADMEFESAITHPWRKYCTTRWEFLPRFLPLLVFAFCIMVAILAIDGKLKVNPGRIYQRTAVAGYVSLEQAGSIDRVNAIFKAWTAEQRLLASFSAGLHFLFFTLYNAVIVMLCCWGVRLPSPLSFLAGPADCPPLARPTTRR